MSVHAWAKCAAIARQRSPFRRSVAALAVLALAAVAASCAGPPPPFAGPDPSDPSARAKAVGYRSTIAPYERQRPVEPAPWREQNDQVAPAPKP